MTLPSSRREDPLKASHSNRCIEVDVAGLPRYISALCMTRPRQEVCVHVCAQTSFVTPVAVAGRDEERCAKRQKAVRPSRGAAGECAPSAAAINYKAPGPHVLIRGINVSSFLPHTPPFASINAAGEQESVRARTKREELKGRQKPAITDETWLKSAHC